MSDDGDDQYTAAVVDAVSSMVDILNEAQSVQQALEILSTATVLVLCRGVSSADEAHVAYSMFVDVIAQAMQKAESSGHALWTRGTSH